MISQGHKADTECKNINFQHVHFLYNFGVLAERLQGTKGVLPADVRVCTHIFVL